MTDLRTRVKPIADLARRMGRAYSHLHRVLRGTTVAGPDLVLQIERETQGAILRWELRPDLWPPPGTAKRYRSKKAPQ